ncbi:MAG: phenylalanine--tRNA ligase subunit beta [Pseudomonadota bacterium]
MKFSLSWLYDHLETNATLSEITDALVDIGIEVEGVEDPAERLKGFVVGHVKTCERHPNADRLSLCTVEDGTMTDGTPTTHQVVCGAPNVRAGMKVAFARTGTVIPDTGLPLKKGSIRGIESLGMLCSSRELLLGDDADGIMDLDASWSTGADLAISLNLTDPVIDVSLTPNRSDCFSIRGIARDLAAFGVGTLKDRPEPVIKTSGTCDVTLDIIDPNTHHFTVRTIKGVKNGQSPEWAQKRLRSAGCRPISALVDATNLICLAYGRPLHVFDKNKLTGTTLAIHTANDGDTFVGLNEKEYTLSKGMTVISDGSGIISLAGIMGGLSTGCDDQTTDIVLESALFDSARIALTGQATSILSDARTRFERGVDAADVLFGLDYATQLILEWCGGTASDVIQAGSYAHQTKTPLLVSLSQVRLTALSGDASLTLAQALPLFKRLGFVEHAVSDAEITLSIPTHRHDITLDVDLIEEALRLRGYNTIPDATLPLVLPVDTNMTRERLNTFFTSRGYNEAYTWSFIPKDTASLFGTGITLAKPLNAEMAVLRPSVLPGLLKIAANGQKRSQPNSAYIEYAPQFHETEKALVETRTLSGLRVFLKGKRHWQKAETAPDIYTIKNDVMTALELFGLSNVQLDSNAPAYYHPGRSAVVKQGQKIIACFGELHPNVVKELNVSGTAIGFEIFIDALPLKQKDKRSAFVPAIYQSVSRDFAFWVETAVTSDQLIKIVQKVDRELIAEINIFDVYSGDKAPAGKKSIAIEVILQPKKQTLNDDDLMTFQNKVIVEVEKLCGGRIRDAS